MTEHLTLHAAAGTDPGRVHQLNQDNALAYVRPPQFGDKAIGFFIVADGMGGHKAGEVASEIAVQTIRDQLAWFLEQDDDEDTQPSVSSPDAPTVIEDPLQRLNRRLQVAIDEANKAITAYAEENPTDAGNLGTTLTCALVQDNQAVIANVGDSRTYLFRNGHLRQLTEDHSYVGHLLREGQIEPEEVFTHPRRNVITRSLGYKPEVHADVGTLTLQPGDQLLLCSDGLWEMVHENDTIAQYLRDADDPEDAVAQLIDAANENGGADNIGIVVVHVT